MAEFELGPIGQIARHVSDVAAAEAWFRDVVGLKHMYTFPSPVGSLAFFDCGGTRLFLGQPEDGAPVSRDQGVLYFRVGDINQAQETLKGRGVEFVADAHLIHRHEDGTEEWMAFFKDLDGGLLALMSQVKSS